MHILCQRTSLDDCDKLLHQRVAGIARHITASTRDLAKYDGLETL